jgi:hypothetical protein
LPHAPVEPAVALYRFMPVIAAYLYRHGRRVREIALDERVSCPDDRSEFVWIGLSDPCADDVGKRVAVAVKA